MDEIDDDGRDLERYPGDLDERDQSIDSRSLDLEEHRLLLAEVRATIPRPKREAIEAAYLMFQTTESIAQWLRMPLVKIEAYLNLVGLRFRKYSGDPDKFYGLIDVPPGQWTKWQSLLAGDEAEAIIEMLSSGGCDADEGELLKRHFDVFRATPIVSYNIFASLPPREVRVLGTFMAAYVGCFSRGPDVERICASWGDHGLVFLLRLQRRDWRGALHSLNMHAMRIGPRYRPVLLALRALATKRLFAEMGRVVDDWHSVYSNPRAGLEALDTPTTVLEENLATLARAAAPGSTNHELTAALLDAVSRRDCGAIDTSSLVGMAYCVDRACRAIACGNAYRCDVEWASRTKDFSPAQWFQQQRPMFAHDERLAAQLEANLG